MEALVGLGGNLGDPPRAFARALEGMAPAGTVVAVSRLYRSEAEGPPQPAYTNAVARIRLHRSLGDLLRLCLALEEGAGRVRSTTRWGPRPLDLDLLLVEDAVCRGPLLVLPHPRCHRRPFVLLPAAEIAPGWVHPLLGRTIAELAAGVRGGAEVLPQRWWPRDGGGGGLS